MKTFNVAIVGATGAVGEAMRSILESRRFPVGRLKLLASERSAGKSLPFKGESIPVEAVGTDSFKDVDFALFSAGAGVSRQYAPIAAAAGAVVIDNSSAFRMDPEVPLVVPEVNAGDIKAHRGVISNPNCSTIQMVAALKPLHDNFVLKRVVVSTYQAVSGTGKKAVAELIAQTKAVLAGEPIKSEVYPRQIAFNILPHIDVFAADGYTKEEIKMIEETRKIMSLPSLAITATAVRVPVITGHGESINIQFERDVTVEAARLVLASAPGIELMDDPAGAVYPTAIAAAGGDAVLVGRIRRDESVPGGLNLWIVGDNLRKGAALNAVQIAETIIAG